MTGVGDNPPLKMVSQQLFECKNNNFHFIICVNNFHFDIGERLAFFNMQVQECWCLPIVFFLKINPRILNTTRIVDCVSIPSTVVTCCEFCSISRIPLTRMPTARQIIRSVGGHEDSLFEAKYGKLNEAPEYLHNYLDVCLFWQLALYHLILA